MPTAGGGSCAAAIGTRATTNESVRRNECLMEQSVIFKDTPERARSQQKHSSGMRRAWLIWTLLQKEYTLLFLEHDQTGRGCDYRNLAPNRHAESSIRWQWVDSSRGVFRANLWLQKVGTGKPMSATCCTAAGLSPEGARRSARDEQARNFTVTYANLGLLVLVEGRGWPRGAESGEYS
jgi:hypothetical protein